MPATHQEIRRLYRQTTSSQKYRTGWQDRQRDIPKWRARLLRAMGSRGVFQIRSLIDRQLHEEPIQSFDKRHIADVRSNPRRLRATMTRLMDDSVPIETRFTDVMDRSSRYHTPGLGNGALSEWLMFSNPTRYGIWNGKSTTGLRRLGLMPSFVRGTSSGERYNSIVQALQELQGIIGARNLAEADLFLHFVGKPEPEAEAAWKRIFHGKMPKVPKTGPAAGSGNGGQGSEHLSERGYVRRTSGATIRVEKLHSQLSNRLTGWLRGRKVRAADIHQERNRTDIVCTFNGEAQLFELKVIGDLEGPNAGHNDVRAAIGQLFDYGFFPAGKQKFNRLSIVTDIEPSKNDCRWIGALGALSPPIELFWFPEGARAPTSARLTQNPLARRAASSTR